MSLILGRVVESGGWSIWSLVLHHHLIAPARLACLPVVCVVRGESGEKGSSNEKKDNE